MALVTSVILNVGELIYELLLVRCIRAETRESRRARSRCLFNSLCSGVRIVRGGLPVMDLDDVGEAMPDSETAGSIEEKSWPKLWDELVSIVSMVRGLATLNLGRPK